MKGRGTRRQKKPPVRQTRTKQKDTAADDTLSGIPRKKMLRRVDRKNPGVLTVRGEYSEHGVWIVLMGGDFEVFVDAAGLPQAFRRRNSGRKVSGFAVPSINTIGMRWDESTRFWDAKNLDRGEFNRELINHLALAVRRCTLDEGAIAKSGDLVQIITDAADTLQRIAASSTEDPDRLKARADRLAGDLLVRLLAADLRKGSA
ncbi:hypothetical protein LCGC14_0399590 [marine sediment metagenome]|uniref:Uncharacterized protein n=1 Tax=marine sediment metagenome TaxID=412755 RepID=A0A0F9TF89_9ZZZZ